MNPESFLVLGKAIGAGIAIGLAGLGAGIAQSRIGAAAAGAVSENKDIFGLVLVLVALPEVIIILGFVVAAMIITIL
jgi:V/A-type H+/Na+-transporting ATPase subunit K